MKTIICLLTLSIAVSISQPVSAQVNLQVNIGNQPLWGPTGYDHVDYYYLPDLDIYYYVPQQQWVYFSGGRWITTPTLPPQYSRYDLYQLHKVVINEPQPYLRNATYRSRYASLKNRHDQQPIRDSRDSRYFVVAGHPQHSQARPGGSGSGQPGGPGGNQGGRGRQPGRQDDRGPQGHESGRH